MVAIVIVGFVNGYQRFYKPVVDTRTLSDVELLTPGESPKIYGTNNFERDINILMSTMYSPVGIFFLGNCKGNARTAPGKIEYTHECPENVRLRNQPDQFHFLSHQ